MVAEGEKSNKEKVKKSKGFGFVEFAKHEDALAVLRKLNNNPAYFGKERRPIVEFAIENSLELNKRQDRLRKAHNITDKKKAEYENRNLKNKAEVGPQDGPQDGGNARDQQPRADEQHARDPRRNYTTENDNRRERKQRDGNAENGNGRQRSRNEAADKRQRKGNRGNNNNNNFHNSNNNNNNNNSKNNYSKNNKVGQNRDRNDKKANNPNSKTSAHQQDANQNNQNNQKKRKIEEAEAKKEPRRKKAKLSGDKLDSLISEYKKTFLAE